MIRVYKERWDRVDRWQAALAGRMAGIDRMPRTVPPEHARFAEAWLEGYDEGEREYQKCMTAGNTHGKPFWC